jgi:hypothetical protein
VNRLTNPVAVIADDLDLSDIPSMRVKPLRQEQTVAIGDVTSEHFIASDDDVCASDGHRCLSYAVRAVGRSW